MAAVDANAAAKKPGSWNTSPGGEEHFTSYSQGPGASLAAVAERLGTRRFCLKEKGYGNVKFNIRKMVKKA